MPANPLVIAPDRPMLAIARHTLNGLVFPVCVSPKVDAVRLTIQDGKAVSRSGKLLPNKQLQEYVASLGRSVEGFDSEVFVGEPNAPDVYLKSVSFVMSQDKEADFKLAVFDNIALPDLPYRERNTYNARVIRNLNDPRLIHWVSRTATSEEEVNAFEEQCLLQGFEGVIGRDPNSPYKNGRSSLRQSWMWKLKRFIDFEVVIAGYTEMMHNDNVAESDELGFTKRSSHQQNLRPAGVLGALTVRNAEGVTFDVGTGFTAAQRKLFWDNRDDLLGAVATVKAFPIGGKDKPRHPVFKAFRAEKDTDPYVRKALTKVSPIRMLRFSSLDAYKD